jgi:uncharacterized membrane protein
MRLDNRFILILIAAFTLLLFPAVALTTGPLRVVLSFLFVIFFPGYALLSALFPKHGSLSTIERIALSFGISIAAVTLIGFLLNFTPWGIKLDPILLSVAAFILICSAAGIIRQQLLPARLRFGIVLNINWSGWKGVSRLQKGMSVTGLIAILAVLGYVAYSAAWLPQSQSPTEFYILNAEGKAEDYPRQVKVSDQVGITIVVVNNETTPANYRVRIMSAGGLIDEVFLNNLPAGGKSAQTVSFCPGTEAQSRKVELYLYKDAEKTACFAEPLYFYIDVTK